MSHQGISYTVTDLRNAAWSAIKHARCGTCGAEMRKTLGGDTLWSLETRPGLSVRVAGRCKAPERHTMTATEAL
jgi:hypothetical protein